MNEITLDEILVAAHDVEFSQYDNVPEHTFSRKHNRVMKRIFKAYARKTALLRSDITEQRNEISHFRWNRKTIIVVFMIIFLAALTGCTAVIYYLGGFRMDVQADNTQLSRSISRAVRKVLRKCTICLIFRTNLNYLRKTEAISAFSRYILTAKQEKRLLFINQ